MLETVNILTGSTFVTSDRLGDIDGSPTSPHGLFASDTRFLSKWKMAIDDRPLAVLSVDEEHYYATQFFLAPSTGTTYVDSPMSVLRRRSIGDSMWEGIGLFNHSPGQIDCHLHIDVAADFADLFEVKDALAKRVSCTAQSKVTGSSSATCGRRSGGRHTSTSKRRARHQ